jgi:hypothetical protein
MWMVGVALPPWPLLGGGSECKGGRRDDGSEVCIACWQMSSLMRSSLSEASAQPAEIIRVHLGRPKLNEPKNTETSSTHLGQYVFSKKSKTVRAKI